MEKNFVLNILVTGGLGNIGCNVIEELIKLHYNVVVFDRHSKKTNTINGKLSKKYSYTVHWGDINSKESITPALKDIDAIIHLVAILPPVSEQKPVLAYQVNVNGTKNLVTEAKKINPDIHIVYASSFTVYGTRMDKRHPIKVHDPIKESDNYSFHKIEAEKIILESKLNYTIIRFGAVLPLDVLGEGIDTYVFKIPLNQRIHFIHHHDVAVALVHAIDRKKYNKIFLGGGGEDCKLLQGDLIRRSLEASGIGMFPEKAFKKATKSCDYVYFDWMDTDESESELQFQQLTYDDYITDLRKFLGYKRYVARLFSPIVKYYLLKKSPYMKVDQ